MGLANWLTVLRIVLIPVFVTLMVYRQPGWALAAFALAAITDLLDGWVARRQRMASRLGAFLDPLADKLLLTASFVTLTYLKTLPFWITAVVLSRDIILIVGALVVHMVGVRIDPEPTRMGKLATFFQVVTVLTGLLSRYFHVMLAPTLFIWLAAVFTVASGCQYLVRGMRVLNAATAVERDERNEHESSLLR
jgi:cardiolipin synthase (CMP-forming)